MEQRHPPDFKGQDDGSESPVKLVSIFDVLDEVEASIAYASSISETHVERLLEKEFWMELEEDLRGGKDGERLVYYLLAVREGYQPQEIAEALKITPSEVYNLSDKLVDRIRSMQKKKEKLFRRAPSS